MNEHVHSTFEDFIEDHRFIEWVQSGFQKHNAFWQQFQNTNPNVRPEIREAIEFIQDLKFGHPESIPSDAEKVLNRIHTTLDHEDTLATKTKRPRTRLLRLTIVGAAAASVAFLFFVFWGSNKTGVIQTAPGIVETVQLPDASKVTVNADSKLTFNEKNYQSRRQLSLEGEAFFEVEKGVPFIVRTSLGEVEVLGTSFNVYSRGDQFDVECVTGRVRVSHKMTGHSVILGPGQRTVGDENRIADQDRLVSRSNWVRGQFNFKEARLEIVLEELERQFNVDIKTTDEIKTLSYTGFFENSSLDRALYAVTWPLSLTYEIENDIVTIKQ